MYSEIVTKTDGVKRLKEFIDPNGEYFKEEEFLNVLVVCSFMIDRAVVKCLLSLQQRAKDKKDFDKVLWARKILSRVEAGVVRA